MSIFMCQSCCLHLLKIANMSVFWLCVFITADATIMTPVAWAQGDTIPSHLFLQEKFPQFLPCTRTEPPYVRRWICELSLPSFKNIIGNMILLSTFFFSFFFG